MKWQNKGHEFEQYKEFLNGKTELALYGVNQKTIEVYKRLVWLKDERLQISFYDDALEGEQLSGNLIGNFGAALEKLRGGVEQQF